MEEHTIFKTATGATYAVSPRVVANGYRPKEGTRLATAAERREFLALLERGKGPSDQAMDEVAIDLRAQGLSSVVIQKLTGIDLSDAVAAEES